MKRILIGGAIGALTGLLLLAAWSAHYGYYYGVSSRQDLSPGWETAGIMALFCCMMFGWLPVGAGMFIGFCAGLASSTFQRSHVYPRRK